MTARPDPQVGPPAPLLAEGAEAQVRPASFLGRAVLEKSRLPKAYRHARLDAQVRAQRTRDEANLLVAARRAGVPVPIVYDVDREAATLRLEHVEGPNLRDVLAGSAPADGTAAEAGVPGVSQGARAKRREALLAALGEAVARMHAAGITHGDLTTSNVLAGGAGLVLIDFGLGALTQEPEPRGVDLHLIEEALEATVPDAHALFAAFLRGYETAAASSGWDKGAHDSVARLDAIRRRGRNR